MKLAKRPLLLSITILSIMAGASLYLLSGLEVSKSIGEAKGGEVIVETPSGRRMRIRGDDKIELFVSSYQWAFNIGKEYGKDGQGPARIIATQGQRLLLRLKSLDVPHGFAIEGLGINVFLPPGEEVRVEVLLAKPGSYRFFCTVFCGTGHANHRGVLEVRPID